MSYNEQETRFSLIDPVLRDKGYNDHQWLKMETPAPVEPTGPKGRRRKGAGRTDYLLCVQVGDMPKALPVGVLEAKKETEDPLKGMQQAKGYADCQRVEVKYVFATNGHLYGEFDFCTNLQGGPLPFADFPPHPDLTARYAKDTGIDITRPEAAMLFQADSPAWSLTRYYQDAAANAPIHIATYQALGLDDEDDGFASFLSEDYGEDAFSVIIIDECHRSAWGKWSEVLKRNPNAIHIGLTATPRKLQESKHATAEDQEITANNHKYFGEPVYESTLIQAQEDGYLAACEIVGRKADIDKRVFTKEEILKAGVKDLRTGKPLTEADLTKDEYTGKDFDDELFIELRTPAMCEDLFRLLCANGGPEQKAIIFCNREIHADRVAMQMNNLYARWCKEHNQTPKDHYAFKRMGGPNNGAEMIEPMRGSGHSARSSPAPSTCWRRVSISSASMPWSSSATCSRPSSSPRWWGAAPAFTKRPRNTSSGSTTTPTSPTSSAPTSSPSRRVPAVVEMGGMMAGLLPTRHGRRPNRPVWPRWAVIM